jgi:hypothetical protein
MKKISLCITILIITAADVSAQKKFIKRYLSDKTDSSRRASFMPVPIFRYSQEIGAEFGLGALYSTYVDRKDSTNRSSNFSGVATISTKAQKNCSQKSQIWTTRNDYHLISEFWLKWMRFNFFGLGN